MSTTFTMAIEPINPKIVVVNQKESGLFKVIYEGEKAGNVVLKIYNESGKVVFAETIKNMDGFSQSVNFAGMKPGNYVIEVTDSNGKVAQTVAYNNETIVNAIHVAKIANEDKYLVAMANEGEEKVNVKIFDGASNLVYDENLVIKGNFGLVYNLKTVAGTPTFEVTDKTGTVKTIKY